jgi:hypothetical protein
MILGMAQNAPPPLPLPPPLRRLARLVADELAAVGFRSHTFLGTEENSDDWRRPGPLIVIRRDHLELWWSVGLRPDTQSGPTHAERRMTPVLLDLLLHAGIDAQLSTPTQQGDVAVWITPRPDR